MHQTTSSDPSVRPPLATLRRIGRRLGRLALAMAGLLVSVSLLVWLTLQWGILPRLDQWRPQIEQRLSAAIGVPVRIGGIGVESRGWVPALALQDVQLLDRQGRPGLKLGQVRAALAPHLLLVAELRLAQLHVDGLALDVRRDAQGRLHVAGVDIAGSAAGGEPGDDRAAAEWLLAQHEIVIRNASLRWTDETRSAPPLELSAVDLVLRNGLRRHDFRLDATPPPEWGDRLALRGQFTAPLLARRSDWQRWSGAFYAHAPRVDVAQLSWYMPLPFELNQGRGAVRAWLEVQRGQWRGVTADLALADVWMRLGATLQPLAVASLQTRVQAQRDADGVALQARQLAFTLAPLVPGSSPASSVPGVAAGQWPAGDISLAWQQVQRFDADPGPAAGRSDPVTGGRFSADQLDLGLLATIAERLPLGDAALATLAEFRPAGIARALEWRWQGPPDAPTAYGGRAKVSMLSLAPSRPAPEHVGRPGLRGAEVEVQFDERGGRASLALNNGALQFPGLFEQPELVFDRLQSAVEWRIKAGAAGSAPAIELNASELRFANADVQGEARVGWRTGAGQGFGPGGRFPGLIDIAGRVGGARAERASAYLPIGIPLPARRYVARAVKGGTVDAGSFTVKGDLWHFPFQREAPKDSVFRIALQVRDAGFDYLPSVPAGSDEPAWSSPWPAFQGVQGEVVIDRAALQLNAMQARLWGVQLRNVTARIDDLIIKPVLQIDGEARGPAADMLRYVDVTPVGEALGGGLQPLSAAGNVELKLALAIPLRDEGGRTTVRGSVQLAGNDVRVRPGTPLLANARGRVDFSQRGFQIVQGQARVFGGEASFDGGTQGDGTLRFAGQGVASAEGLRRASELGLVARIAPALRGQANYKMQLTLTDGWPELTVTSDLVGLEADLPPPLAKPAASVWPLRWQSQLVAGRREPGQPARDLARLDIGDWLQARVARRLDDDGAVVLAASVGVFESVPTLAAPSAEPVWQVRSRFEAIDVDAWQAALSRLDFGSSGASLPGGSVAAGRAETPGSDWPAMRLALRADALVTGSRRLTGVQAEIVHDPAAAGERERAALTAQVRADQGQGRLQWFAPRAQAQADQGRLVARLGRFVLPEAHSTLRASTPTTSAGESAPARLPTLDIEVEEFIVGDRSLGRLELQARPLAAADRAAREPVRDGGWQLQSLTLAVPGARVLAQGQWAAAVGGAPARMTLDFGVDIADSGALAARFGMPETMRGGKGKVEGRLTWPGSPLQPALATLDGQVRINLEAGQFLRAEPGVARLLGILSLQSLPRRLLLDFRDVFEEGFSFDNVRGDVAVAAGRAKTDNLRMRGVHAVVALAGSADLTARTQDIRIVVVPDINAGTASLAYAAINPAVALGTFLAQLVLREPLAAAGTREFHVTGRWDEPKVERVERSLDPGAPAAGPGSAPAKKEGPGG